MHRVFFLKKLISFFILPPVNLALAVLIGLLVTRWRPRAGHWIIGIAGVLLLLLAVPAVGGTMLALLERGLPTTPPPDQPPGAIVILGAEVHRTAGAPPAVEVGRVTLERLRAGVALYRRTHLPILVSGGVVGSEEVPVGTLMAQSLRQDFQVPVQWVDSRSRDTWENAQDSAAILRSAGIRSVYVVTHPWHERRAMIAFRRAGLVATAAPSELDRMPGLQAEEFVPALSAWIESFYALHEWIGCAWYALP